MSYPDAAWNRLGELLIARRTQIDPSYHSREKFAAVTGLNPRLVYDIERAKRRGFKDSTINSIEHAYEIAPGSVRRALEDPSMTELPARQSAAGLQTADTQEEPEWATPPPDLPRDIIWNGLPDEAMQAWHWSRLAVRDRRLIMSLIVELVNEPCDKPASENPPRRANG
jgi:hypothetical protein